MNKNEAVMKGLIDSINAQIWSVDKNYLVLYCNQTFVNMLKPELGHDLQIGEYILNPIYGEEVVKTWKAYYDRAFNGERFEIETVYITPDEQEYITHYVINPIYDNNEVIGVSVFGGDISEKKRAEKIIRNSEANLKALIGNTDQPIWSINNNFELISYNEAFRKKFLHQFGHDIKAGDQMLEHIPEKIKTQWSTFYERALKGDRFAMEYDEEEHGGTNYYEVWFNPIFDEKNRVIGAAMFGKDITQIKRNEQELIKARDIAEDSVRTKSEFLATMSHEIKTPMNAIVGLTSLLLQAQPRADQLNQLETLKFSAENLMSLLNNVLDLTKLESNKMAFEEAEFSIDEVLNSIRNSLIIKTNENEVDFIISGDSNIPEKLLGDQVRLTQILYNLTCNAVKFTQQGSVTINALLEKKNDREATIMFSVKDTGLGIHPNEQERIFDIFTQANSGINNKFGGTGLGLAIAKKLIEKQGSELHLISELGKGSEFFFSLNFKLPTEAITRTTLSSSLKELKGIKALIVDDNQINCMVAKKFLEGWEVDTTLAYDGFQALEKTKKVVYDFILMDIRMPGIDGYEATKRIRQQKESKNTHTPIIALTAAALEGIHEKAEEAGMNDYMLKPFNPKELYAKILKNISGRQTTR